MSTLSLTESDLKFLKDVHIEIDGDLQLEYPSVSEMRAELFELENCPHVIKTARDWDTGDAHVWIDGREALCLYLPSGEFLVVTSGGCVELSQLAPGMILFGVRGRVYASTSEVGDTKPQDEPIGKGRGIYPLAFCLLCWALACVAGVYLARSW